jgi:hypothetical protein
MILVLGLAACGSSKPAAPVATNPATTSTPSTSPLTMPEATTTTAAPTTAPSTSSTTIAASMSNEFLSCPPRFNPARTLTLAYYNPGAPTTGAGPDTVEALFTIDGRSESVTIGLGTNPLIAETIISSLLTTGTPK